MRIDLAYVRQAAECFLGRSRCLCGSHFSVKKFDSGIKNFRLLPLSENHNKCGPLRGQMLCVQPLFFFSNIYTLRTAEYLRKYLEKSKTQHFIFFIFVSADLCSAFVFAAADGKIFFYITD